MDKNGYKRKVLSGIVIIAGILIAAYLSFCIKMGMDTERDLKVLKGDSWFDDFYIKEGKVYMKCEITIRNMSNHDQYFRLSANMEEDAENGLIKDSVVSGCDNEGNETFFIEADQTKQYHVLFVGDFAGNAVKQDRNLPEIELVVERGE